MGEFDEFNAPPAPAAHAGGEFSEFDAAPAGDAAVPDTRSFLARAKDKVGESFSNFGHTVASAARGAVDLVSPISKTGGLQVPFGQLADTSYRHQLERGISDTVTGGLAEKAANAVSPEFAASAQPDAVAAPNARALGQGVGAALPSPFSKLAELGGVIPGTGPLAAAARGVAGYEASSVPQAATQAAINAPEGHRVEAALHAAREAATDPASLALGAGVPAVTTFLKKRLDVASDNAIHVQDAAKARAVKDLGKDITSAEGPKAKVTDQKRIAEVNDRLYDLADKDPELRQAFSEPAEKALPKIRAFKSEMAKPLDKLYDAIDEKTDGGLDPHAVVADLRGMAKEARRSVSGLADSERLGKLADQFEQVYITEREPPAPSQPATAPATQAHGMGNAPPGLAEHLAGLKDARKTAKGVAAKALDERIAEAKEQMAGGEAVPSPVDAEMTVPEKYVPIKDAAKAKVAELEATEPFGEASRTPPASNKIPTRVFRAEVTDLLKKSDSVMGGIEGAPRFEALQKLYDAGKTIIDKHIDGSGLPPAQIAQLRDINNGYFLLSRAESAIESRGWKEANREGFHFAHSARQALHGGLVPAAAYGMMHPHAIPYIAGAAALTHAVPAAAKRLNWSLAHGSYGRAVGRLVDLARRVPRAEFIGQAARAGMSAAGAQKIYDAAQRRAPAPTGASQQGDITL